MRVGSQIYCISTYFCYWVISGKSLAIGQIDSISVPGCFRPPHLEWLKDPGAKVRVWGWGCYGMVESTRVGIAIARVRVGEDKILQQFWIVNMPLCKDKSRICIIFEDTLPWSGKRGNRSRKGHAFSTKTQSECVQFLSPNKIITQIVDCFFYTMLKIFFRWVDRNVKQTQWVRYDWMASWESFLFSLSVVFILKLTPTYWKSYLLPPHIAVGESDYLILF